MLVWSIILGFDVRRDTQGQTKAIKLCLERETPVGIDMVSVNIL